MVQVSKLQTETALSTMEAKIIALAHCCWELFSVMDIVAEIGKVVSMETKELISTHVSMLEYWSYWSLPKPFLLSSHHKASTMQSRQFGLERRFRSKELGC